MYCYLCKLIERSWIATEELNVKHCLWIRQLWEVNVQPGVDAILAAEVRYATRNTHLQQRSTNLNNIINIMMITHCLHSPLRL